MEEWPLRLFGWFFLFLLANALFASAEAAFSSASKARLKHYAEEHSNNKRLQAVVGHLDRALLALAMASRLTGIIAVALFIEIAASLLGEQTGLFVAIAVMTVLSVFFGEILPKSMAKEYAEPLAIRYAGLAYGLMKLMVPITALFQALKERMTRRFANGAAVPAVTEEDIKVMVELSEEEGVIDNKEKELIQRSLDFDEILVGEIFTPRADMVAVEVNQPIEEIRDVFLEEKYSRIPVYEGDIDNVIGILSESDFFSELVQKRDVCVRELLRQPLFVVESMKVSDLLPELQKSKVHMAIVVDEFGGTAGLITLEDILEQIVGEIWDEHDEAVKTVRQIDEHSFEFSAELPLDEFCEVMNIDVPESESHTLGGWIFEMFERIPAVGETLQYGPLTLTVRQVDNRRIRKVLVSLSQQPLAEQAGGV
ncbi:hemolysin family protein [Geobacillus stearothermophilus]|uniref:hemolysin family protein n=1 Tax=Geobacillus stearothermophilus TaxID=1422 RepID=UPI000518801B|nr:hemolysin family protein [Geobacillus stearothermophilus]MED3777540.1 hemolysin family protein [Geobacillus stearothermophilus]MED4333934.1 hemolysin family protein [Geobacillus stearothermophilus]MED4832978.1 hemolysin family protein [Geobacillus stearothermophilus]MED4960941.1 hemolysin family protein [Geobacillus stearothermophilus]MED4996469.1 hemolysin family protein [Geobacillus stearothermophilus]